MFRASHRAGTEASAGAAVISRFNSKLTDMAAAKVPFITRCWIHGLGSSLAVGRRHLSVLGYVDPSIGQLTTWQLASLRTSKRARVTHNGSQRLL